MRISFPLLLVLSSAALGFDTAVDCSDRYGLDCSTWPEIHLDPEVDDSTNGPFLEVSNTKTAHLHFSLTTVNQPVGRAILYFFGKPDRLTSAYNLDISVDDGSWIRSVEVYYPDQRWYPVDVTEYVQQLITTGNTAAGFAISSSDATVFSLRSGKTDQGNMPQLVILYDGSTPVQDLTPRMPHMKNFSAVYSRAFDPPPDVDEIDFAANNLDIVFGSYANNLNSARDQIKSKNNASLFLRYETLDYQNAAWDSACTANGWDCEKGYYHDASIGRTPDGRVSGNGHSLINHGEPLLQQVLAGKVQADLAADSWANGVMCDLAFWYFGNKSFFDRINIMELPPAGAARDQVYAAGLKGTYQAVTSAIAPGKFVINFGVSKSLYPAWRGFFDGAISGKVDENFILTRWEADWYEWVLPFYAARSQEVTLNFLEVDGQWSAYRTGSFAMDRYRDMMLGLAGYYLVKNAGTFFYYEDAPCWGYYGYDARRFWLDPMIPSGDCRSTITDGITLHYQSANSIDVGLPMGTYYKLIDSAGDTVYAREYTKAMVYLKVPPTYPPDTSHPGAIDLPGDGCRLVNYDGTLGAPTNTLTLNRNEGAIVLKPSPYD